MHWSASHANCRSGFGQSTKQKFKKKTRGLYHNQQPVIIKTSLMIKFLIEGGELADWRSSFRTFRGDLSQEQSRAEHFACRHFRTIVSRPTCDTSWILQHMFVVPNLIAGKNRRFGHNSCFIAYYVHVSLTFGTSQHVCCCLSSIESKKPIIWKVQLI